MKKYRSFSFREVVRMPRISSVIWMHGMHVHEAVVKAGERESGITIHYINEHYDEGASIFQASCPVLPSDTPDEVAAKVHALEYAHYPHVIESLL